MLGQNGVKVVSNSISDVNCPEAYSAYIMLVYYIAGYFTEMHIIRFYDDMVRCIR